MKATIKRHDYVSVLKYLTIFLFFIIFNRIEKDTFPYSIAILSTALVEGCSILITPLLLLLSFIVCGATGLLLSGLICSLILIVIMLIYKKSGRTPKHETCAYVAVSLVGFMLLGDTSFHIDVYKRTFVSLLTVCLSLFCIIAGNAVSKKGLKFKWGFEEKASVALLCTITGLGICNFSSPLLWKSISIIIILTVCYLYRTGIATIISAVLGLSLAFYYKDINYVSIYIILAIVAECLSQISRHVSAISIIVADYAIELLFNIYGVYGIGEFLPVFIGAVIFCIFPTKALSSLKEHLYSFREKQLVRQSINRNRSMLSGRLYDLSGVFSEMASAFSIFNNNFPSDIKSKEIIEKQLYSGVCSQCEHRSRCNQYEHSIKTGISKLVDIGFAKGKLSLIDLPKEIGDVCFHPNDILYFLNKLLADYRATLIERINVKNGRDLLAEEATGISEILRGLALETGTLIKYHTRLERNLTNALFKNGFLVEELLIFGEEELISVNLIIVMKEFSIDNLIATISNVLSVDMMLNEQTEISEEKWFLSFKKSPPFDAVFGLACAVKDSSEASGDTHSVTRLNENRFLLALSDGMGSGNAAKEISSASLALIESFYKAGLKSSLVLNTVNKLLAINTEDSFAALDVSILDLTNCSADFIKYGSPYGFIVGKEGVRIVEGNSLPLGIIDELKPSVCHTSINPGDMIILLTDGISDAFSSSSDMIDFLRSLPAKNPQTIADEILNKAISLSNGKKNDDMTVLAVRVYKRKRN